MQIELNFFAAENAKEVGMMLAEDNANNKIAGWSDEAMDFLMRFLNVRGKHSFQAEEFRVWAQSEGMQEPPSWRAMGGVIRRAKNLRIIRFVRIEPTSSPTAHRANASVWEGT